LEERWQTRYEELKVYKLANGHCHVPRGYPSNPPLATWVYNQRLVNKEGKMKKERKEKLDELDFF